MNARKDGAMKRCSWAALGLLSLVFCTSCESAAERQRKEEASQRVNPLLERRFETLSKEDQAKWQMQEVHLFGPYRLYGPYSYANWEIKELTDGYEAKGSVWFEGTDLAGQVATRRTELSLTIVKGQGKEDWRVLDYQVFALEPLTSSRQLFTWLGISCVFLLFLASCVSMAYPVVACIVLILQGWANALRATATAYVNTEDQARAAEKLANVLAIIWFIAIGIASIVAPGYAAWGCFNSPPAGALGGAAFLALYLTGAATVFLWFHGGFHWVGK
jgi:hypothetical protein